MHVATDFGTWLGALFTIGIASFLYKDNPLYKFCESVFVGVSAGYWAVVLFWDNMVAKLLDSLGLSYMMGTWPNRGALQDVLAGHWNWNILHILAAILGVMMILRLFPKVGWISRWPLAVIVGSTAGLWMVTYFQSNFLSQLQTTTVPLIDIDRIHNLSEIGARMAEQGRLIPFDTYFASYLGNLVLIGGTLCGLIYFYFSREHKGAFGGAAKVGIYFLMITFGASFGYTVMSRMSLLIGRLYFLFSNWLGFVG
jgi:hypothetical protein